MESQASLADPFSDSGICISCGTAAMIASTVRLSSWYGRSWYSIASQSYRAWSFSFMIEAHSW